MSERERERGAKSVRERHRAEVHRRVSEPGRRGARGYLVPEAAVGF